jgi:hypothetical protein
LFPRKYHALFELHMELNKTVNLKFIRLTSVSEPMEFLDRIVQKAFLKKLALVDQDKLKNFLLKKQNNFKDDKVDIMLEFKENNG